jgi:hypothetical protein
MTLATIVTRHRIIEPPTNVRGSVATLLAKLETR